MTVTNRGHDWLAGNGGLAVSGLTGGGANTKLIAFSVHVTESGTPGTMSSFSTSGWSGTAPTFDTPQVATQGSSPGLAVAVAVSNNSYTGSGTISPNWSSPFFGAVAVVEVTDAGGLTGLTPQVANGSSASPSITLTGSPSIVVALIANINAAAITWSTYTDIDGSTDDLAPGVSTLRYGYDDSSPGNPTGSMTSGGWVEAAAKFTTGEPPPTHPQVDYQSEGAGVGTETSSAGLAPACPASVDPGDILIAQVIYTGTTDGPSTPSGWTLLHGPANVGTTATARHWAFGKLADGSEDGASVSFGTAGGTNGRAARIYSFRLSGGGPPPQGTPVSLLVGSLSDTPHATDPQGPTVTTVIKGSRAVALTCQDDNNVEEAIAGASGGTWGGYVEYSNGTWGPQGIVLGLQHCIPTSDPGTISGGAQVAANDEASTIGFYIAPYTQVPALRPQRRRNRHPTYY